MILNSLYVFISIKSQVHMKVIFKDWNVENSGTKFFLNALFAETLGTCVHHHSEETCTS